MEMEMQVEPIVAREVIRLKAFAAADAGQRVHDTNPFPSGTQAHRHFEIDFWARERWLNGEETC